MKKLSLSLISLLIGLVMAYSQVPQAFNYQAIARDTEGNPISNQDISLRISLLQGDKEGPVVYCENQLVKSNSFGLINLIIGKGSVESGSFADIDWAGSSYFVRVELDTHGGHDYKLSGTSELYSVPYALCAGTLANENSRAGEWNNDGTNIYVSATYSANNVGIGTTVPSQKLHIYNGSGVANFLLEGTYSGSGTAGMSNFYLKNSSGGALFGFFFKKESGTTFVVQSAFDGTNWIAYSKLNYSTKELEYKEGLVDIKFSNTGNVLFKNTGNVGIGTTSPSTLLHIYQNAASTTPQLMIQNANAGGDAAQKFTNASSNFALGIDNNDSKNFEISNTSTLTGTSYTDANTLFVIHNAEGSKGIVDINHQSRARAYCDIMTPIGLPFPPLSYYWDASLRPWLPIPFDQISPLKPGFDGHSEFTLLIPSPTVPALLTSYFSAKEAGYYQINARLEIPLDSIGWDWYMYVISSSPDRDGNRLSAPPWPILLSIGIFVNGNLYAQGNNYQMNSEYTDCCSGMKKWESFWFMNAPNVSDVIYLDGESDYVEICLLLAGFPFGGGLMVPFPLHVKGDVNGVSTYVSIHKLS